jgi:predicted transcriptional regulator
MADDQKQKLPPIEVRRDAKGYIALESYKEALKLANGYKSLAAHLLGVTPSAVSKRIARNKSLKKLVDELVGDRDTNLVETAENKLMAAVKAGERWAVKYVLDNKGAERGFSRKLTIDGNLTQEQDPLEGFTKLDPETQERLAREAAKALLASEGS